MKKIRFSSLICLAFMVVMMFSSIVFAENLIDSYLFSGTSGTQTFTVWPKSTSEVIFEPWENGSWYFQAYHCFIFGPAESVSVFTYWRDVLNPSDPWHYFGGGGSACLWFFAPQGRSVLYSGSSSIAYKFELKNYHDSLPLNVKIKLTKK